MIYKTMKNIMFAGAMFSLTGCALAWGGSYKVEHVSESSITISYDPSLTNMGEVQNKAQEHCD